MRVPGTVLPSIAGCNLRGHVTVPPIWVGKRGQSPRRKYIPGSSAILRHLHLVGCGGAISLKSSLLVALTPRGLWSLLSTSPSPYAVPPRRDDAPIQRAPQAISPGRHPLTAWDSETGVLPLLSRGMSHTTLTTCCCQAPTLHHGVVGATKLKIERQLEHPS
jgi:hypothetical protein